MRGEGQVYHICIFYVIRSISLGKTDFFWAVRTDLKLISAHGPKIILYMCIYIYISDPVIESQRFDIKVCPAVMN